MPAITRCRVPGDTYLARYLATGAYTDCYTVEIPRRITFPEYMFAFYTTPLFKLERLILNWTVSKPSTDLQTRQLANGVISEFAAWHVENRQENEILLCDFQGRTRSWLMLADLETGTGPRSRLYFGSAVVPSRNSRTGKVSLGFAFQALLGFHRVYSVLLLASAASRLSSRNPIADQQN